MSKEPEDIYSATYVLLMINRFFGTAPYALTNPPNRKYEIRPLYVAISCIKIITLLTLMVYSIIQLNETTIIRNLKTGLTVLCCGLSSVFIAVNVFRAKYIVLAFKILNQVDNKFRSLGIWMEYKQIRKQIYIQLSALFVFIIFLTIFEIIVSSKKQNIDVTHFVAYIPQAMIFIVEIQYYNYLYLAMCRYRILNEYLETLEKEKNIFATSRNNTHHLITKDRKLSAGILKTANVICNPYLILETVADLHIQLTDMCILFNKSFSIQLLFRVTTSLIGIIFTIFYFIVDFQYQYDNNFKDYAPMMSALMVFGCMFCISELYVLARISDKTCQEANNIPLMLHNIKHSCSDSDILDSIELYSIQMYHNKLQFSVCGLFTIDHTLLYSMTGAVTTYLIFLVQFSKSKMFSTMLEAAYENL